jgi:hypothetical protein
MTSRKTEPSLPAQSGGPDVTQMPEDVRRFILSSVGSVPYLEALLLLRSAPEVSWGARQVAQRLYIGEKLARELLQDLASNGVAAPDEAEPPQFRYQPISPQLHQLLEKVVDFYARHLVAVTHLIHSRTDKRAHQFANAFRWRKDS